LRLRRVNFELTRCVEWCIFLARKAAGRFAPLIPPDGLPYGETMKGVVWMSVYEVLVLVIEAAMLVIAILSYIRGKDDDSDKRK
jgi:hypothetical protein